MKEIATNLVKSGELAKSVNVRDDQKFDALYQGLLNESGHENLQTLIELVQKNFSTSARKLVSDHIFKNEKQILQNAIIVIKISPLAIPFSLVEKIVRNVHLISLIERIANNDNSLDNDNSIQLSLSSSIVLPSDLFPLPRPNENFDNKRSSLISIKEMDDKERKKLVNDIQDLRYTMNALRSLHPQDYVMSPVNIPLESGSSIRTEKKSTGSILIDRSINYDYPATVKAETIATFPQNVKSVLSGLNLDLTKLSVDVAKKKISDKLGQLYTISLNKWHTIISDSKGADNIVSRIGNNFFPLSNISAVNQSAGAPPSSLLTAQFPLLQPRIMPVGVGDLLVVKHNIKSYEAGQLADIKNILKGESSKHSVRRQDTVEESITTETQTTKEEERDLQTTERFDLKNETQNTINEQGSLAAGLSLSPSYGPVLEFQGDNNTPISGSQQLSQTQASSFSKDVTTRAASKVSETVKKQVMLRTVHQFEDKNFHGFDNSKVGSENVIGIYQWIDKVYEAQVFSYGKRLMYDIVVPEPAAFINEAVATTVPEGQGLVKPPDFDPEQVDETSYMHFAQMYGASGNIQPPPQSKIVTKTYILDHNVGNTIYSTDEIPIPGGYKAYQSGLDQYAGEIHESPRKLSVSLGPTKVIDSIDLANGAIFFPNAPLHEEEGSIGVIIMAQNVLKLCLTIEIKLNPTDWNYENWKIQTRAAIQQAYLQRLSEYEERLANLQMLLRSNIMARNPDQNLATIKTELKKACISLFTYQQYDTFGAIKYSPQTYPEIDFDKNPEAQGSYIRFLEQAFEWEQIVYFFYPYFWGRKDNWTKRFFISDSDPNFADFLMAGAARVVVPVRPGFELALTSFIDASQPWWIEGSVPDIGSDLSASLIQEIKEVEGAPLKEVPYGDPWEVRLTTTLVKIRDDSKLPSWKEDPPKSGNWVPDQ